MMFMPFAALILFLISMGCSPENPKIDNGIKIETNRVKSYKVDSFILRGSIIFVLIDTNGNPIGIAK